MPTQRFLKLKEEKKQVILEAAVHEFSRVPYSSASINQIIKEADISRGSFYTYFESKYDLLRWLISDRVREHNDFYVRDMEENGGDIWLTLSRSLEHTILHANDGGFMGMVTRLIGSKTFFDLFKESVEGEKGEDHMECKRSYLDRIYGLLDQTRFPMDFRTFTDLMDLHAITLVMALKKKLNGECGTQEAMDFYNRRINLLRYGVCPQRAEKEKTE